VEDKEFEDTTIKKTIELLKNLAVAAGIPKDCKFVAGGFSAWRYALRGSKDKLVKQLIEIRAKSGVPVYLIPIPVEGTFGYQAAKAKGLQSEQLTWDIGGGSMQIAKHDVAWGNDDLGQRAWRDKFCTEIRGVERGCSPNPISPEERTKVEATLAPYISDADLEMAKWNKDRTTVTAISAPVARTMLTIVRCRKKIIGSVGDNSFDIKALSNAVEHVIGKNDKKIGEMIDVTVEGCTKPDDQYISTSVTDMLLVHTFMKGLSIDRLEVLPDVKINNAVGIIGDDRAFAWEEVDYSCYLNALLEMGLPAYVDAKPADCP
jgi:hypothetical protein